MISGLVHVARPGDADVVDRLADTLNALVAGVAAGLVGDAVIVAPHATEALEAVAEGSGAVLVLCPLRSDPWRESAMVARREWVLCLDAGDVLREGWIRTLDRFTGTARADEALGRLRRSHAGWASRLVATGERFIGASCAKPGDLVRRELMVASPSFRPRLKARRLSARLERV